MLLTLWNDDEKYRTVYWSKYENWYYPGDYALKDDDDYLWLLGRADDVLKVAGHRIGTAELESCIVSHNSVAESAVCGIPDEIKGEVIVAFVVLKKVSNSDNLEEEIFKNTLTLEQLLLQTNLLCVQIPKLAVAKLRVTKGNCKQ